MFHLDGLTKRTGVEADAESDSFRTADDAVPALKGGTLRLSNSSVNPMPVAESPAPPKEDQAEQICLHPIRSNQWLS